MVAPSSQLSAHMRFSKLTVWLDCILADMVRESRLVVFWSALLLVPSRRLQHWLTSHNSDVPSLLSHTFYQSLLPQTSSSCRESHTPPKPCHVVCTCPWGGQGGATGSGGFLSIWQCLMCFTLLKHQLDVSTCLESIVDMLHSLYNVLGLCDNVVAPVIQGQDHTKLVLEGVTGCEVQILIGVSIRPVCLNFYAAII